MLKALVPILACPYCGGRLRISRELEGTDGRVSYGLLACRCFEFPIVEGILLLSLAKGYGGAEEELSPYVPLQAAAIAHLQRDDPAGLRTWIDRHLPLAGELIRGRFANYLDFRAAMLSALDGSIQRVLADFARYEVDPASKRVDERPQPATTPPTQASRIDSARLYDDFYVSRFFAPRVNALALQLEQLRPHGRQLSLCCGHGVYEHLLRHVGRDPTVVSVDGQFLNVLCARTFVDPQATYICHDVQFGLPFVDGAFDGVFSSTCVPEVPGQRTFIREAIRVTAPAAWTVFDSIWTMEIRGVQRVDPQRHYRFCQNHFASNEDYVDLFLECAGADRRVGWDVAANPDEYACGPRWIWDEQAIREAARDAGGEQFSVLVTAQPSSIAAVTAPAWLSDHQLAVSPVFDVSIDATGLQLTRKAACADVGLMEAPWVFPGHPERWTMRWAELDDPGYLRQELCASRLVPLFERLDGRTRAVASMRPAMPLESANR